MINAKEIPEYTLRTAARHTLDAIREWMAEGGRCKECRCADAAAVRRSLTSTASPIAAAKQ